VIEGVNVRNSPVVNQHSKIAEYLAIISIANKQRGCGEAMEKVEQTNQTYDVPFSDIVVRPATIF
jgi:hypothetical protein